VTGSCLYKPGWQRSKGGRSGIEKESGFARLPSGAIRTARNEDRSVMEKGGRMASSRKRKGRSYAMNDKIAVKSIRGVNRHRFTRISG
jgi:hypothetical protein